MRQFLVDEFRKFKIEVVELIQYVSKFKTLTMNIQTYLSIALLVFLGIDTNVFILSLIPGITYTQYDYNMISYVGAILYALYIFSINYMRLNYYEKDSFNWLNIVIIIFLIVVLLLGNSITISSSNFRFASTTDYIWFYGRSTVRQWGMFNVFLAFIIYNFVVTYTIEPSILRYALYIYLTYTVITMVCRRLIDSNSSVFWLLCLFVPLVNIYVLYLLYNKTSAVYDQESNSIFYYPL